MMDKGAIRAAVLESIFDGRHQQPANSGFSKYNALRGLALITDNLLKAVWAGAGTVAHDAYGNALPLGPAENAKAYIIADELGRG